MYPLGSFFIHAVNMRDKGTHQDNPNDFFDSVCSTRAFTHLPPPSRVSVQGVASEPWLVTR